MCSSIELDMPFTVKEMSRTEFQGRLSQPIIGSNNALRLFVE